MGAGYVNESSESSFQAKAENTSYSTPNQVSKLVSEASKSVKISIRIGPYLITLTSLFYSEHFT